MNRILLLALLTTTFFASGCYFTAGFSRTAPHQTTICNTGPGYSVTHYRSGYGDAGNAAAGHGGSGDCSRPGYCCPDGLCDHAL